MKSPKKNSRINTRLSISETENIPTIIFNKFSNEANIIVNELIEKIISLSISKNYNKKIENSIPSSCFDFLCNAVDSYLSLNFISYDKEEINDNNNIQKLIERNKILNEKISLLIELKAEIEKKIDIIKKEMPGIQEKIIGQINLINMQSEQKNKEILSEENTIKKLKSDLSKIRLSAFF